MLPITCGMPLPRVARSFPSVAQASSPNTTGVTSKGIHAP